MICLSKRGQDASSAVSKLNICHHILSWRSQSTDSKPYAEKLREQTFTVLFLQILMSVISFKTQETLFQFFVKRCLDPENLLTEDQWDDFVDEFQSVFAHEATDLAKELFQGYIADLED